MDIHDRLAHRLRQLREARGLSLDALAARSGVSRSNISLIERAGSSPTATVLDKLSVALGVTLASLFEDDVPAGAPPPSPLARAAEQPLWTDPASGYRRRNLSPPLPSPLQMVEVEFPPGRRVALETAERNAEVHQQVWMVEGRMDITLGEEVFRLSAGDCLAMRLDRPIAWRNPGRSTARYLVALATLPPGTAPRRTP